MINHTRHSGIFDASRWGVRLIGAGGIGAITAIVLAKMGIAHLEVHDPDVVSEENIATQFYRVDDLPEVGWDVHKVVALEVAVRDYSGLAINEFPWAVPWPGHPDFDYSMPIIISAVDSITARQEIWEAIKPANWIWYLDARMAAEQFMLYAVKKADYEWYDKEIYSLGEEDVQELPCTAKATTYCGAGSAAFIGAAVRKIVTGYPLPRRLVVDFFGNTITEI